MEKWTRAIFGKELVDGRQDDRFKVHDGALAALCHGFTALGQIIDISRSGLSFRYVASEARTNGSAELSILITDGSFSIERVPFKTVWDAAMPREFSFGAITLRHCGVQFGDLSHGQRVDLEYFIRSHTTADVWAGRSCHAKALGGDQVALHAS
jgi:hypothetical protein